MCRLEMADLISIDPIMSLVSFLVYLALFFPLEHLIAMHQRRVLRPAIFTDLCFLFGHFLLWTPVTVVLLLGVIELIELLPLMTARLAFVSQPFWLQVIEAILLSDVLSYWYHRLCHHANWLWRFHSVHHSTESMDWIAAYREHPLDNLLTRIVENLPLLLLDFPLAGMAGFVAFRGLWTLFIHSNIDVSPGILRFVLGSPRLHHWHHAISPGQCNFSNLNPLIDCLFGTYHDPGVNPERYGIAGEPRRSYLALIVRPLLPKWIVNR
jgi:sterol desaturase/sphingolipid hydroxylase (fatty acid hydroxylase superfamily)